MSLAFLFIVASTLALSYRKGETFSYRYNSAVTTAANQETGIDQSVIHSISCQATFKVLSVSSGTAYLQMNVLDVESSVSSGDETEEGQHDEDSEASFAEPIYFTHNIDGTISNVVATETDEEETVQLKTSVLYGLQTSLTSGSGRQYEQVSVIDPQGSHYEFFTTSVDGDKTIVSSHYTQDDFLAFADEETDEAEFSLDSSSIHSIVGGRVVETSGSMTIVMNKATSMNNEESDDAVELVTVGTASLSSFAQGNDEEVDFPYESVEAFLNAKRSLVRVKKLHPSWYLKRQIRRKTSFIETDELDGFSGCPGDIDFCKGFDKSWTVGNSNIGLRLTASANAGVKKGCKAEIRSYAVGARVALDILVLGKTVTAAAGYAEYGQVNGSPLRNGIELKLFGTVFYSKTFPWLDCIDRTIQLKNWSKDYSFSWSILVFVVHLKFSVGITFGFNAQLHYQVCPQQLKASCQLIPTGSATLHGGASASVAVARAGIEIRGTVSDYLDPIATVDGNICRVSFAVYNNVNPIDAKLVGWWQTRKIKWRGFKTRITWGSRHEKTFWHHTWSGSRQKILDVFYGAK